MERDEESNVCPVLMGEGLTPLKAGTPADHQTRKGQDLSCDLHRGPRPALHSQPNPHPHSAREHSYALGLHVVLAGRRYVPPALQTNLFSLMWLLFAVVESVGSNYRRAAGITYRLAVSLGLLVLTTLAYALPQRRWLQLVVTLPNFFFCSTIGKCQLLQLPATPSLKLGPITGSWSFSVGLGRRILKTTSDQVWHFSVLFRLPKGLVWIT